eukprot:TRINITY_DN17260_c0_g1_i3.p1 TRINITY_DN17260_c0_g1~~TRINITY_DN17260_c0_g1_i3.p1  ORF type:complete len:317 (+),score=25.98 TRINITY_DN17260_c0_g1_i3:96-1046(+)
MAPARCRNPAKVVRRVDWLQDMKPRLVGDGAKAWTLMASSIPMHSRCRPVTNSRSHHPCFYTFMAGAVMQRNAETRVDVLEKHVLPELCIDLSMVWASGCSNGAMFLFELARDMRMAKYLAGIVPMAGLPHVGFNVGPSVPMSLIGFWGEYDPTVPPISKTKGSTKACEHNGWCYSTSENTTRLWADKMSCQPVQPFQHDRNHVEITECWVNDDCSHGHSVLGCHFRGGHICNRAFMNGPMLEFIFSHPKSSRPSEGDTTSTTAAINASTTTDSHTNSSRFAIHEVSFATVQMAPRTSLVARLAGLATAVSLLYDF